MRKICLIIGSTTSGSNPKACVALTPGANAEYRYLPLGIQEHSNTVSLFKYAKALGANYILAKEIQNSNFSTVLEKVDTFLYKCNSAYITICTDVFPSYKYRQSDET